MKTYLSKMARGLEPYTWEFGSGKELRFNSNTLPFPSKSLAGFLKQMQKSCPINEYADPNYTNLKKLLGEYENISPENLTITNSGDEAIDIVAKAFLDPGDFFVVTPPTYEMFSIQCEINRGRPVEIPLQAEIWEVDAQELIKEANNQKVKLIFLCNPNNPTGSIIPQEIIETIVKKTDAIVVVDETYREFYGQTSVPFLKKYDNLVILRSFSKFAGIAGARIGYLIANKALSEKFDAIRFPMGVSYFSYKLAENILKNDRSWIKKQVAMIKKERTRLTSIFESFGWRVYPSEANFLLVNIGSDVKNIYEKLKQENILIRDRSRKKYLDDCARITVRSEKENDVLVKSIKNILARMTRKYRYAFIDRDGTLIFEPQDTFQIDSIKKLKILNGVIKGLQALLSQGYTLIMITNQDGLGTASFPNASFEGPQKKMLDIFAENGIRFKKIFVCPHLESQNCACRKPKIGLVTDFLKTGGIDKENSFVMGNRASDKQFAKNIGIQFIPINTNGDFYEALLSTVIPKNPLKTSKEVIA